jgi:cytochrome c2
MSQRNQSGRGRRSLLTLALFIAVSNAASPASADPPPAAFGACATCHAVAPNAPSAVGPNLYGVFERRAGSTLGYNYSQALRQSGIVWTGPALRRFIENPTATAPGTTMPPGVGAMTPADRDAIVSYLAQLR